MRDKIQKMLGCAGFGKKQVTILGKHYYIVTIHGTSVSREAVRAIVSDCGGFDDDFFLGISRKACMEPNRHLRVHVAHACEKLNNHDCETSSVEITFKDLKFMISKHGLGCIIKFSPDVPNVCYCDSNSTDWSCLVMRGEASDYATRAIQEATLDYKAFVLKQSQAKKEA